jgi:CBS domain containing-hemolysin-like protein
MGLLLLYLTLALSISFLCSLLEASLLSVSPGYVSALVEKGNRAAKVMAGFKATPDRALAAILTCNTIGHTAGAAGVGAQVVAIWGEEWLGIGSAILTLAILFLTEIVPKTLGTKYAQRLVRFTARTIQGMVVLLFPLVWVADRTSRLLGGGKGYLHVSREEIAALADMGRAGGELTDEESRAIRNLLALRNIRISDIMTPRPGVQSVDAHMTLGEFAESERETPFARLPVTRDGNIDDVVGVIHRVMILDNLRDDRLTPTFGELAKPLEAIPASAPVSSALEKLLGKREHMMLVVDEYGGTAGVVTLEDVLETLLGVEILDESDAVEDMREYARKLQQIRQASRVG